MYLGLFFGLGAAVKGIMRVCGCTSVSWRRTTKDQADESEAPVLGRIERANLVLAVLLTALAGVVWGARGADRRG